MVIQVCIPTCINPVHDTWNTTFALSAPCACYILWSWHVHSHPSSCCCLGAKAGTVVHLVSKLRCGMSARLGVFLAPTSLWTVRAVFHWQYRNMHFIIPYC